MTWQAMASAPKRLSHPILVAKQIVTDWPGPPRVTWQVNVAKPRGGRWWRAYEVWAPITELNDPSGKPIELEADDDGDGSDY